MTKELFMNKLKELLSDVSPAEREEALSYYEDYISDAGEENEEEVIASLGSPEKVAQTIKASLEDDENTGEYGETGYSTGNVSKDEVVIVENRGKAKRGMTASMIILLVILGVFALPVLGPVAAGVFGALLAIVCAVFALLFAFFLVGVALTIAGIALIVAGIIGMFTSALAGGLVIGVGLILFGIGLAITWLGLLIVIKGMPPLIRGFVNLCRKPFAKKGV